MADDITDLKRRVAVLEDTADVEVIERARMEKDLEGVKRDVAGLKATQRMHQQLVDASNENRDLLKALGLEMDRRFDEVDTQFHGVNSRIDGVTTRIDGLETSVNARFDKVDERFAKVDERFDKVDERFDKVEADISGVKQGVQEILRRLGPPPGGSEQN